MSPEEAFVKLSINEKRNKNSTQDTSHLICIIILISIISSTIFVTYISTKIYHERKNKKPQHNPLHEHGF